MQEASNPYVHCAIFPDRLRKFFCLSSSSTSTRRQAVRDSTYSPSESSESETEDRRPPIQRKRRCSNKDGQTIRKKRKTSAGKNFSTCDMDCTERPRVGGSTTVVSRRKGNRGKLAGIVDIPTEVFLEVMTAYSSWLCSFDDYF